MEFTEKIRLHNEGEYDLAEELVTLALSPKCVTTTMISTEHPYNFWNSTDGHYTITFKRWRPEYKPKYHTFEYRLAYNFRIILARHAKPANSARKKWMFSGDNHEIYDFDVEGFIYETLKEVGHEFYKDDFHMITEEVLDKVEERFGVNYFLNFRDELREFQNILPYINRQKRKYYDEISPLIIEAINETLPKVDLNRSDDDIVAFIAQGVRWRTYNKLNELWGVYTYDRNGEKYYVKEEDMMFRGVDGLIGNRKEKPTRSQREFLEKLSSLISEEFAKRNIKVFTFNKSGQAIEINKRYFSERMGLEESAFKKRLDRLRNHAN